MTPDQLTDDQKALIHGLRRRPVHTDIAYYWNNIAAVHFDGPHLAECIALANQMDRVGLERLGILANKYGFEVIPGNPPKIS